MISRIFSIFRTTHQTFEGESEGERILIVAHKHLYTIILPLAFIAFLACGPILAWSIFKEQIASNNLMAIVLFFTSVWYLCLWLAAFYSLTMYILNEVIITDERIIDNHQLGFFDRKVSELHIHRIQDVSVHTVGVIETLLHFGDLVVQTAAEEREFIFTNLPRPDEIKDIIMNAVTVKDRRTKAMKGEPEDA